MKHSAVLIAGGGMAGLALALLLRRHGVGPVTLVEAADLSGSGDPDTPSFDARSTALSAGALEILERADVAGALLQRGETIAEVHVSRRGRPGVTRLRAEEQGLARLGSVVENRWFGRVLLDAARRDGQIELLAPARLAGLTRQRGGYRARLEDGEERECALLVAADGARSRTRDWLGISARHRDTGHDALVANVRPERDHGGVAYERFVEEGPLALLPMTEGRMALIWTGPRADVEALAGLDEEAFAERLAGRFGRRLGSFSRIGSRHRYPLVLTEACAQVVPHAVVVGNAAHTLHPVAGQGFNLTLRDLASLAAALEGADNPGELARLEAWQESRQADQALIARASGWLPELFRTRFAPVAHGRQLGLVALDLLPGLRQGFARRAMGMGGLQQ